MKKRIFALALALTMLGNLLPFMGSKAAFAATTLMDSYLRIDFVFQNSDGSVSVNYTMLKAYTLDDGTSTSSPLSIGYQLPASYRTTAFDVDRKVDYSAGSHTMVLPSPGANICLYTVYAKLSTPSTYSEYKSLANYMNAPAAITTSYYTVPALAAGTLYTGLFIVPGVALSVLVKKDSPVQEKIVAGAYAGFSYIYPLLTVIGLDNSFPLPSVGQYYRIDTYYSKSTFTLNTRYTVWTSYESYQKNVTPIFQGTTSQPLQ